MPQRKKSIHDIPQSKVFVLDTNVLLHESTSLFSFKNATVIIPFVVLEELDLFKKKSGEKGRNAREVIRALDELRGQGCLSKGVRLGSEKESSLLKVLATPDAFATHTLESNNVTNTLIGIVEDLAKRGYDVTFITKDINARVKADSLGLAVEDYTKGIIQENTFNKGWLNIPMSPQQLRNIGVQGIHKVVGSSHILYPNEFVVLSSEKNPENNRLFRYLGGTHFQEVTQPRTKFTFQPRNLQQHMALDLLLDDSIKLVSLIGPAGTGKTFLALLAGLQKVATERVYRRLLVARPIVALGADIGFLPGEVEDKLLHWMKPIHDNLEHIFSQSRSKQISEEKKHAKRGHQSHNGHRLSYSSGSTSPIETLKSRGLLSIEAITYMRGRSIPYQYIFIDEVQNLTPHEVKTIVSRAGDGSKIILAGDPHQIDSPYLDFTSNGLTVVSDKFKGEPIFGTVYLHRSERSKLAELAAKKL